MKNPLHDLFTEELISLKDVPNFLPVTTSTNAT